jgi:hypothetical protein
LLCPTDHTEIDAQPGTWPEERLLKLKQTHENLMASRTSHGQHDGLVFEPPPGNFEMPLLLSGARLLAVVGNALAYNTSQEEMQTEPERDTAADLLQSALDWGEIYNDIGPSGHRDAERDLDNRLRAAVEEGVLLYGAVVETTVRMGDERMRWPVGYLRLRRAVSVAETARPRPTDRGAAR